MKGHEIRHMVGDRIFDGYWPDRLYNHDAEDRTNLIEIGRNSAGHPLVLNKRAAQSDLLVYVNLNFVAMNLYLLGRNRQRAVSTLPFRVPDR